MEKINTENIRKEMILVDEFRAKNLKLQTELVSRMLTHIDLLQKRIEELETERSYNRGGRILDS